MERKKGAAQLYNQVRDMRVWLEAQPSLCLVHNSFMDKGHGLVEAAAATEGPAQIYKDL